MGAGWVTAMTEKMTLKQAEEVVNGNKYFLSPYGSFSRDGGYAREAAHIVIAAREAERDEARRDAFTMARRSNFQMRLSDGKDDPDAIAMIEKYSEATDENTK